MSDKKVMFLTPSVKLLGARRSLCVLAQNLSSPFTPHVVCSNKGPLLDELNRLNISANVIKHYNWRKGKYFFHTRFQVYKLKKLIDELNPAIIHANEVHSLPQAVKARGNRNIPIVVHNRLTITPRQIKNYYLDKADAIIAVSNAAAKDFDHCSFKDKVHVVYNGLDTEEYKKTAELINKGLNIRRELGIGRNDFLAGIVGLIGERKRQHIAVLAAEKLAAQHPDCHFLFIGDPSSGMAEYAENLKHTIKEKKLENIVHLLPFRTDIKPVYTALDLNLLISAEEGFGRTIIEAGALGIPSIGTKIGGIPEIIREGETGFLIDLDDYGSLAEIIVNCKNDREVLGKMGEKARVFVEKNFSIKSHCEQIMAIYKKLLKM